MAGDNPKIKRVAGGGITSARPRLLATKARSASSAERKGGGGKLSRSETVTVRLDPQLRYLVELAARKHRRTVSSFVEWAVGEALSQVILREECASGPDYLPAISVGSAVEALWDVDEPDRLAKLAFRFPELLTHDEQVLWKLIRESRSLWIGGGFAEKNLCYPKLRDRWKTLNALAKYGARRDPLPKSEEPKSAEPADDIPF